MNKPIITGERKGHTYEIRRLGEDYFTKAPWLGLFIDGDNASLKHHGESPTVLKREAVRLIDAQEKAKREKK